MIGQPVASRRRIIVATLLVLSVATLLVPPAAAQQTNESNETVEQKAPYYANESDDVDNESWMAGRERPSLPNVIHYASRIGTFVIGDGGANGPGGAVLIGLLVLGSLLGTTVSAGVGTVGGAVLTMASLSAVAAIDIAPSWPRAVALFGLGLLLSSHLRRVLR